MKSSKNSDELLEESDKLLVAVALQLWANYIETGSMILSAKDCEQQGKSFKALTIVQMKKVVRLRELANRVLESGL